MHRVCLLEEGKADGSTREDYLAIRARYQNNPLYWLVAARTSSGEAVMDAAERCVSLAPRGPYAPEGRRLMARSCGLSERDGQALRTRMELESLIQKALAERNPALLSDLFPLLALPDNPYTLYTLGALKALAEDPLYKAYFAEKAGKSSGRLAERLRYLAGGRG